jgi:hypothetical protein
MLAMLRVACRQYAREAAFALTVVCTLAVTIGATAAVFAVVNAVIVRPLPFPSSDELVWIASGVTIGATCGCQAVNRERVCSRFTA